MKPSYNKILSTVPRYAYLLFFICLVSLFLSLYKHDKIPACINSDEAAFGYNAYSIAKTGKDEYGTFLPLRLKSFGDYKMPVYSYLAAPLMKVFGLNDFTTRGVNYILAFFFPLAVFFLVRKLNKDIRWALLSALLVALSLGLHNVGRFAHEAYVACILITLTLVFLMNALKKPSVLNYVLLGLSLLVSLFAYQSSRLYAAFFLVYIIIRSIKERSKKNILILAVIVVAIGAFTITDIIYKPDRVKNLFLYNITGITAKTDELRAEGGPYLIYNKATLGLKNIIELHLGYFSPQFLAVKGDTNVRFGYTDFSPMSMVEYLFIFVGLYFLIKNKEEWRYFLLSLFFFSPIAASLSWGESSLTRALFMLVPALILSAYGMIHFVGSLSKRYSMVAIVLIILLEGIFLGYSWDFYFNHYPKRATAIRSWQCGYEEVAAFIKENYDKYDKFYITKRNGEPYIFLLYYLKYDPAKYQKNATLTPPDEYGFGQVENFDKFVFDFKQPTNETKYATIGVPDEFDGQDTSKFKKIKVGIENMFWIYEKK